MQKGLTAFQLKILGITLMVCDHIHQMFALEGAPIWLTMIGRIVAPVFLFLSAEGFHYTRNKLAYLRNLLVGFWIMSVIQQVLSRLVPNDEIVLMNNIFGTLFIAVLLMYAVDLLKTGLATKSTKKWISGLAIILGVIGYGFGLLLLFENSDLVMIAVYGSMIIPNIVFVEGGFLMVLLALFFYLFRGKKSLQLLALAIVALISTGFSFQDLFLSNFQWMMLFAAIPLYFYNGQEGRKMKWFFYFFYPAHLVILYLLATWL
ncbi:TraX family protein [uncultured Vagococcus sp.]|uniref:TraX family protein n=1 Tax=uncultured Vagococcus sp. TaxID=189676 RepID=UPI0028D5A510|nr:TraX family protein [uncultured Vagococcus sp.]